MSIEKCITTIVPDTTVPTGMRQEELLGLGWKDVDLALARASITQTLYRLGRQKIFKKPKSAQAFPRCVSTI